MESTSALLIDADNSNSRHQRLAGGGSAQAPFWLRNRDPENAHEGHRNMAYRYQPGMATAPVLYRYCATEAIP